MLVRISWSFIRPFSPICPRPRSRDVEPCPSRGTGLHVMPGTRPQRLAERPVRPPRKSPSPVLECTIDGDDGAFGSTIADALAAVRGRIEPTLGLVPVALAVGAFALASPAPTLAFAAVPFAAVAL